MASSPEFVSFVVDQLEGAGTPRAKQMFGDYMIYVDERPLFLVCDNTLLCKQLPCLQEALKDVPAAPPYEGAKPHYVLDADDREGLCRIAALMKPNVPVRVPKAKAIRHG